MVRSELSWPRKLRGRVFPSQTTVPGIPAEYHQKVFEKFGQVEMRKDRNTPSSGLGLTFCKLAAEAQGGNIQLESEPGRGATFHVRLPLPAAERNPANLGTNTAAQSE